MLCCAVWSSTFLFIRIGNDTLAPVWAAGLRLVLATLLLSIIAWASRSPWPSGAQRQAALWFGFMDFGVSLPLLYWGETQVTSGVAAVLYATIPLWTALFARAFGLERLRPAIVVGSLVGIVGVGVLFSAQMAGATRPLALLAVFLGAMTASLSGVLLKRAPGGHPFTTNALAHGIGGVTALAVSLWLRERWSMPDAQGWLSVGYLTVVGSIGAFVAFAWLVQRWSVTRISFISVIIPVVALALGVVFRGEALTPASLVGSGIVLIAVAIGILGDRGRTATH